MNFKFKTPNVLANTNRHQLHTKVGFCLFRFLWHE